MAPIWMLVMLGLISDIFLNMAQLQILAPIQMKMGTILLMFPLVQQSYQLDRETGQLPTIQKAGLPTILTVPIR